MAAVALRVFYGGQDDTVQKLRRSQPSLFDIATERGFSPAQIRTLSFAIECVEAVPKLEAEYLKGVIRWKEDALLEEFSRVPKELVFRLEARIGAHLRGTEPADCHRRKAVRLLLAAVLAAKRLLQ